MQPGQIKRAMARSIRDEIKRRGLTQTEAARIMGDAASQVSLVCGMHLRGFSIERLAKLLTRIGRDVTIMVTSPLGQRSRGKLTILTRERLLSEAKARGDLKHDRRAVG